MAFRFCWTLAFFLVASTEQSDGLTIQPCPPILKPIQLFRRGVITPEMQLRISNDSRNLIHQIFRGPCLQLEYADQHSKDSSPVAIYGTCNYERMFRYTRVHVAEYDCWQLRMAIWEAGNCAADRLTDDFHSVAEGARIEEMFSGVHITLDEGVNGTDRLGRECVCNTSGHMAAFWRQKCPDGNLPAGSWQMDPRKVVELVVMLLGIFLLGWIVAHLVVPRADEGRPYR